MMKDQKIQVRLDRNLLTAGLPAAHTETNTALVCLRHFNVFSYKYYKTRTDGNFR